MTGFLHSVSPGYRKCGIKKLRIALQLVQVSKELPAIFGTNQDLKPANYLKFPEIQAGT
jgi:hypothetical protein